MPHQITLITGDGVGPELAAVTRDCIDATGVDINWIAQEAGSDVFERTGTPMPQEVFDCIRETKVAIKAPVTTPVGKGFRSVNVALRQELDLYACLRPCKTYPGVKSAFDHIDLVVVRENTEDLYAGIEFQRGTDECRQLIDAIESLNGRKISDDSGISIKPISETGTARIVRFAFDYAKKLGRRKVTAVHKANIMKFSDGLFLDVSREVAKEYGVDVINRPDGQVWYEGGEIEFEDRIVDNMCMQLVQKPELYDVLVLPNLYGDILSDLCAGLAGGLGVAPGGNIGDEIAVFEATHGSAPKYKGLNKVNPTALILSGVMMLRHIGEAEAAERLDRAVAAVISEGKNVTYDLKPHRDDPTAVGTIEMGRAIIEKLEASV